LPGKSLPGSSADEGIVSLLRAVRERAERVRLLYIYPSGLTDELIDAVGECGCPYFDLSLQHVSRPLLRRMRRFGDGARFLEKISIIRRRFPEASLRSSFIVGYPGETEEDHDALLAFLDEAQLDWAGFFAFSNEVGTYAANLAGHVPPTLVAERAEGVLRSAGRHNRGQAQRPRGQPVPGSGGRARQAPQPPGGARDRRHHLRARPPARGQLGAAGDNRGHGPGPGGRARGGPRRRSGDSMTDNAVVTNNAVVAAPWRLKTAANGVTVARLAATPVLVVIILRATPSWGAVCFWTVLAFSDFADGWLARRRARAPRRLPRPSGGQVLGAGRPGGHGVAGQGHLPTRGLAGRAGGRDHHLPGPRGQAGVSVPGSQGGQAEDPGRVFHGGPPAPAVAWPSRLAFSHAALWLAVVLAWASAAQYLLDSRSGRRAVVTGT